MKPAVAIDYISGYNIMFSASVQGGSQFGGTSTAPNGDAIAE